MFVSCKCFEQKRSEVLPYESTQNTTNEQKLTGGLKSLVYIYKLIKSK